MSNFFTNLIVNCFFLILSNNVKDRAVHKINVALIHIETHTLDGIVYFADDDNVYSVDLSAQIRQIRILLEYQLLLIWLQGGMYDNTDANKINPLGTQIHATIPRRLINNYAEILKEGMIYKIQHFEVAATTRSYRPVTSTNNIIKWTSFTSIVEDNQSTPIAKHKFEFHPIDNLADRANKTDYLIGVLTIIESKKKIMTSNGETTLRHIYVEDERKQPVRVTLWGDKADLIDETTVADNAEQMVVVITSGKVVDYKGESQLQSTYATKVYVNLNIPETRKFNER
ncbi:hypothetical protein RND81_05G106500 [Saponaria officinalis]